MPNEPVQVVTNPEHLQGPREKNQPGKAGDDFFEGDNEGFRRHRDKLVASLRSIAALIASDEWTAQNGGAAHLKVAMGPRAIAKSHRPQRSIFQARWTPHVATARIGEPIYAVTSVSLAWVIDRIAATPLDVPTKLNKKTGEVQPNPKRPRCEVSAISSITLWGSVEKRSFSAAEGAAWISRAGTGGAYLIDFFPIVTAENDPSLAQAEQHAVRALQDRLATLAVDARARPILGRGNNPFVALRVLESDVPSRLELGLLGAPIGSHLAPAGIPSDNVDRHQEVLRALEGCTLVRDITLPPLPQRDATASTPTNELATTSLPTRGTGDVARVGVIDGGVSDAVEAWVEDRWGQISDSDRDAEHGTFISGLLVAAGDLNPSYLSDLPSGCGIIDVDVLPADPGNTGVPFEKYYPNGVSDFMDEVESAVREYRARLSVRVFNFSMNFAAPGDSYRYGFAARRLDQIARDNDVIFVISAGNLDFSEQRPEWPAAPNQVMATLVADTVGTISEPAESLFNVSVSALNPPRLKNQVPYALARYSRRGPGLSGATKPDFAHVGGSGTVDEVYGNGLVSIDAAGQEISGAGTSYAAPLVARQLADLDSLIDGNVPREVLIALLVHYSVLPKTMSQPVIFPSAKDLVGFGMPVTAEQMLQRPDTEIAIVVNSIVLPGEQHTLKFTWPEALSIDGKCRGYARLTLVARPVLAYEHGDERIRVNIDAKLMQQKADGGYENTLHATNQPRSSKQPKAERALLQEAHKWQVVKCFEARMRGRGERSNWKLLVEYLTRAEEQLPTAGVEFAAVLTIADDKGKAPIFQQMRQHLGDIGVRTGDIRTSVRTRINAIPGTET
ncbi:hypothetical protein D6T64_01825 [Cryobacterium melibiosiphilum]|uniref:Peptidase S8/S53 domain-containing protein n=1 Tax=Cryobacterium melibiosiphilum TaxID=995039 RepID=A0A3A5MMT7_9MICO|nr:S8 family peptidase [Cryobacterium melibiosiphilum]RJT91420.1 hypothetical protein D6T64_01825 [Cryobacterium melibiosiphilum]